MPHADIPDLRTPILLSVAPTVYQEAVVDIVAKLPEYTGPIVELHDALPKIGADIVPMVEAGVLAVTNVMNHPRMRPLLPDEVAERAELAGRIAPTFVELQGQSVRNMYTTYPGLKNMAPNPTTYRALNSTVALDNLITPPFFDVAKLGGGARAMAMEDGMTPQQALLTVLRSTDLASRFGKVRRHKAQMVWETLGAMRPDGSTGYVAAEHLVFRKNALGKTAIYLTPEMDQFVEANCGTFSGCPAGELLDPTADGETTLLETYWKKIARCILTPDATVTR